MTEPREIKIHVPVLARVEGEGSLQIDVRGDRIETLHLRIFEPPRMFEKFLEGRSYHEIPDAVARICGICPVAYQMSAVQAIETAFELEVGPWVQAMRKVLYYGEWIQSHALHIHLLAAPDFLGFENAIAMADEHPQLLRRGLRLQELGNRIMALFGGRSVHPVGVRVGGFHRAPAISDVQALCSDLETHYAEAMALLQWTLELSLPQQDQDFVCIALGSEEEYPIYQGFITDGRALKIDARQYPDYFREFQVPHSTALHSTYHPQGVDGGEGVDYLVGPLARLDLHFNKLPASVRELMHSRGFSVPSGNLFHSVIARAAEICLAIHGALELLRTYSVPDRPYVPVGPRAGTAAGCSEAPRGILWHQYEFDRRGRVVQARIVPPTSQNQRRIETDLRLSLEAFGLDRPEQEIRQHAETVVRNYDPCISCATHFLELQVRRA